MLPFLCFALSFLFNSVFPFLFISSFLIFFLRFLGFSSMSVFSWNFFFLDEFGLFLVFMLVVVFSLSLLATPFPLSPSFLLALMLFLLFLACFGVFTVDSLLSFYFFYEMSLLPIATVILVWGLYPERAFSSFLLLIFTSVFSLPFLFCIFFIFKSVGSLSFVFFSLFWTLSGKMTLSFFLGFLSFLAFSVKLPLYGLHFWLPMAHVEAPTFGSMLLAGVLLKLGGMGLFRMASLLEMKLLQDTLMAFCFLFLALVAFICGFQPDFKRLIAYSSVSHMMAIPLLFLSSMEISKKALLMGLFFHGLSSPLLFLLVGNVYAYWGSRQLSLVRGSLLISPLLSFFMVLSFFFTLSAPPFPSYVGEVCLGVSLYSLSVSSAPFFMVFLGGSLLYNLNWLVSLCFSSFPASAKTHIEVRFSTFLTFSLGFFLSLSFIFFLPFF